jgi:hypothetical protein
MVSFIVPTGIVDKEALNKAVLKESSKKETRSLEEIKAESEYEALDRIREAELKAAAFEIQAEAIVRKDSEMRAFNPVEDEDELRPQQSYNRGAKLNTYKFAKNSQDRLRELRFDPMEAMVEMYEELSYEIKQMEKHKLGRHKNIKYSAVAHASLLTIKQKLINDLMRYGYARQVETIDVRVKAPDPLSFTLVGVEPTVGEFNDERVDVLEGTYIEVKNNE